MFFGVLVKFCPIRNYGRELGSRCEHVRCIFLVFVVSRQINVTETIIEMARIGPLSIWTGLCTVYLKTLYLSQAT